MHTLRIIPDIVRLHETLIVRFIPMGVFRGKDDLISIAPERHPLAEPLFGFFALVVARPVRRQDSFLQNDLPLE